MECSGGKLIYEKANGPNVWNGVIEVTVDQNINGMNYKTVGNLASGSIGNISRDHVMYILPNQVDFTGSYIAWGVFDGYTTWFKSRVATFPFVQVRFEEMDTLQLF